MRHFLLTCCGDRAWIGTPDGMGLRDDPHLAFLLAQHADHGMEVVEYEPEPVARAAVRPRPKTKPRARGPQRELALG